MADQPAVQSVSESKLPLIISFILLAGLVGAYFFIAPFHEFVQEAVSVLTSEKEEKVQTWVSQFGYWGPLIILGVMLAQMFLFFIPSIFVMIASALAFGPWWGSLLTIFGVSLSASLGYMIGAYLGTTAVDKLIGSKTEQRITDYVERYGFWVIIIARISPALSNDATSFVGGMLRMSFWKFMTATLAGTIPLALLIAYWSQDIDQLKSGLLWFSGISFSVFVAYVLIDRKRKASKTNITK